MEVGGSWSSSIEGDERVQDRTTRTEAVESTSVKSIRIPGARSRARVRGLASKSAVWEGKGGRAER